MQNKRFPKNLIGEKFNKLLVVSKSDKTDKFGKKIYWDCLCDCGKPKITRRNCLLRNITKSCGCLWSESKRIKYGDAAFNKLYKQYIRSAKISGRDFYLSKEEFKEITSKNCYYCGQLPKQCVYSTRVKSNFYGNYVYNGIDRIDNSIGYIYNNCQPCCGICNRMKSSMNNTEFLNHIKRLCQNISAL